MFQIIVDTSKVIGDAFYAIMDLRLLEFFKVAKQISKGTFFLQNTPQINPLNKLDSISPSSFLEINQS